MRRQIQIEEVTAFRVDGVAYDTLQKAKAAKAKAELALFLEDCGVGRGGMWDTDMFRDFLIEHAFDVRNLLGEFVG